MQQAAAAVGMGSRQTLGLVLVLQRWTRFQSLLQQYEGKPYLTHGSLWWDKYQCLAASDPGTDLSCLPALTPLSLSHLLLSVVIWGSCFGLILVGPSLPGRQFVALQEKRVHQAWNQHPLT